MHRYVAVYPVALSVRSTNVYEEQSLGIFETEPKDEEDFEPEVRESRGKLWGRYLAMHARRQLSFGELVDCFSLVLPNQVLLGGLIRYLVAWSCSLASGTFSVVIMSLSS